VNKLLGMRAFARVVEFGGFTAAAASLGMSVSAVAKSVTRLEEDLGLQLLVRSTRQVAVNDYGREFYPRCVQILKEIDDAEASLQKARTVPQGRLRILLPASFGRATFLPQLANFTRSYPEITLDVQLNDRPVDLVEQSFDLAVHIGELDDSRLMSRLLTRGPRVTAASPAYIARHGEPKLPHDLIHHSCIVSTAGAVWPFRVRGRKVNVRVPERLLVSSSDALRETALLGLGIIQANWWTLRHDLAAGTIRPLLQKYAVEGSPISVVYPPARHMPQKLRVMIDFLVEITRLRRTQAA
jgi:DNA-binding transcriptional LysR family regulator